MCLLNDTKALFALSGANSRSKAPEARVDLPRAREDGREIKPSVEVAL